MTSDGEHQSACESSSQWLSVALTASHRAMTRPPAIGRDSSCQWGWRQSSLSRFRASESQPSGRRRGFGFGEVGCPRVVSFHTWTIHCHPRIVVGGRDGFWSAFGCFAANPTVQGNFQGGGGAGTLGRWGILGTLSGPVASWPQWIQPLNERGNSALPSLSSRLDGGGCRPVIGHARLPGCPLDEKSISDPSIVDFLDEISPPFLLQLHFSPFSSALWFRAAAPSNCNHTIMHQPQHPNTTQYCLSKHPITLMSRVLTSPFAT
jgi:hypothetical protein